jgi:hypothetical protein
MRKHGRGASAPLSFVLTVAAVLSATPRAHAQANDRSSPMGGRSALMGNTGVALGRDGAAPFTNPATIMGIEDRRLAFSVNFLSWQLNRFHDWHEPDGVDPAYGDVSLNHRAITSQRFTAVPSTVCLFLSFAMLKGEKPQPEGDPTPWRGGRQKFAICLGTLESEDVSVPALSVLAPSSFGTTAQDVSLTRKWGRSQFGPTYSVQVNDRVALGASLQGAYTTLSFIQDATSLSSAMDGSAVHSSLGAAGNGYSVDLTGIVGGTYQLGRTTLGASIQLPSLHLFGSYQATLHQTVDAMTGSTATLTRGYGNFHARPPVRFALGVGREFSSFTLEADASFDLGYAEALSTSMHVDDTTATDYTLAPRAYRASYSARALPVFNAAVGGEFFLTPHLSVLSGLWTNLSAYPPLEPKPAPSLANLVQSRAHRIGVSLGLGSYRDGTELLIGTQLGYGWGESIVANLYAMPNDWSVVQSNNFSALLVLAGSTSLRAIKGAIEGVERAFTPSKTATPPEAPPAPADTK